MVTLNTLYRNKAAPEASHILIVDDEIMTVDLLKVMLRTLNHTSEGATSGHEALRLALTNPPQLIILDLMLPDMTGFEVCRKLRANASTARVPIIVFTARHDHIAREEANRAGANYFLTKPLTRAKLIEYLDIALLH
jgi:DNA-binding response OmpR family regulator